MEFEMKNFKIKKENRKVTIDFNHDFLFLEESNGLYQVYSETNKGNKLFFFRFELGDDLKHFSKSLDKRIDEYLKNKEDLDFKFDSMVKFLNRVFTGYAFKKFEETELKESERNSYELMIKENRDWLNLQYGTIDEYYDLFKKYNIL